MLGEGAHVLSTLFQQCVPVSSSTQVTTDLWGAFAMPSQAPTIRRENFPFLSFEIDFNLFVLFILFNLF